MPLFTKKPVTIEAITFEELVSIGREQQPEISSSMPWSFDYKGHHITHENDECYLIPTLEGDMKFTPNDMLITGVNGEIYPCKKDIFEKTYTAQAEGISIEQKSRLLAETQETAERLNKLNAFMASPAFPGLPREDKDLLYSQQRVMSEYVQILGKRLERAGAQFAHAPKNK